MAIAGTRSDERAPAPPTPTPAPRMRHIRALDGLRGVAVLAVVLYHFSPSVAPGGFLGVDLFFVLSGFLITSLLVNECEGTGRLALGIVLGAPGAAGCFPRCSWCSPRSASTRWCSSNRVDAHHVAVDGVVVVLLRRQLALHRFGPDVHPAVPRSRAEPAAAHVVARDRGAVLPGVAAHRVRGVEGRRTSRRVAARCSVDGSKPRSSACASCSESRRCSGWSGCSSRGAAPTACTTAPTRARSSCSSAPRSARSARASPR